MDELVSPEDEKVVNDNPMLLSLLYDANLLPEQIDTKLKGQMFAIAVRVFLAGQKSMEEAS